MPSNQVNGTNVNDSETKSIDAKKPIKLLRGALRRNELFSSLYLEIDDDERSRNTEHSLVSSFERYEAKAGESLCVQGKENNYFFVVENGHMDVLVKEDVRVPTRYGMISKIKVRRIASLGIGNSFGERAILEKTKSGMTVRATTNCTVWRVKREDVSKALSDCSSKNSVTNSLSWRKRVSREVNKHSFFQHLHQENIKVRVINSFFPVRFKAGETVIHENGLGDNFYIIDKGELDIYRVNSGSGSKLVHIQTIGPGDSIGELAIKFPNRISDVKVKARTDVSLLAMERSKFQELSRTGAHVMYSRFKSYSSAKDSRGEPLMTIDDFLQCQEDGTSGTSNNYISPENRGSTNHLLKMLFRVASHHSSKGERRYIDFNSYYHLNVLMHKSNSEYEIAFKIMDYDNNGRINREELELLLSTILRSRNMPADKLRVKQLVDNTVPDNVWQGRGYLTYEDFCKLIRTQQVPYLINEMCSSIRDEADSWHWQINVNGAGDKPSSYHEQLKSDMETNKVRKATARRLLLHAIDFVSAALAGIVGGLFLNPFSIGTKSLSSLQGEAFRSFVDYPKCFGNMFSYSMRSGFVRGTQFSLFAYASSTWGDETSVKKYAGTFAVCCVGGAGADVLVRPTSYLRPSGPGGRVALLSVGPRWALHFACFDALKEISGYNIIASEGDDGTTRNNGFEKLGLLGLCGIGASVAGTGMTYPLVSVLSGGSMQYKHFTAAILRTSPVVTSTLVGITMLSDYFQRSWVQRKKKRRNLAY